MTAELTDTEKFTNTLFLDSTLEKVHGQFYNRTEILSVKEFDINFRLLFVGENINLELIAKCSLCNYFRPIGFFDKNLNIFILKEYEKDFEQLKIKGCVPINLSIKTLSINENAVIAAFSMDTMTMVIDIFNEIKIKGFVPEFRNGLMIPPHLRYDKQFMVNGLISELIMSMEGYPQFYLDDVYNLNGAIGAYMTTNNGLSMNPTVNYKNLFDKFHHMKLLSAFKNF